MGMIFYVFFSLVVFQLAFGAISVQDVSYLGWDNKVANYAGYVDVAKGSNTLFYWFFESRNKPAEDPVILWFNGGPGCSSMKGLAYLNGPGIIQKDLSHINNPYSWNSNASVIFLDQPAGTGFSESNAPVRNDHQAAVQTYEFLYNFFYKFPDYKQNPLHISGFSDAGHIAAALGAEILNHADRNFNFHSISAFAALLDAKTQYGTVHAALCGGEGVPAVLNRSACATMQTKVEPCLKNIQSCQNGDPSTNCSLTLETCMSNLYFVYTGNLFNLVEKCATDTPQCYSQDQYYADYYSLPEIQQALHVPLHEFKACNRTIYEYFAQSGSQLRSSVDDWAKILNAGIPVLFAAGEFDGAYNPEGIRQVAENIPWKKQTEFSDTALHPWIRKNQHAGDVQHFDLLTYLKVKGAGHAISWDQPEVTLTALNRWLDGHREII